MREHPPEVTAWLDDLEPEQREQVKSLARLVHDVGTPLSEAIKWRRLTFTPNDDWHHWLCQIAVTKKGTSLVFHKGVLLDDRRTSSKAKAAISATSPTSKRSTVPRG